MELRVVQWLPRHRPSLAAALACMAVLIAASPALGAAPANDDYANAATISSSLPVELTGQTNADATTESGEPLHGLDPPSPGNVGGASVWYSWTAPASPPFQQVEIHTCHDAIVDSIGPTFDTLLDVYTANGAVPPFINLSQVAGNDDIAPATCGGGSSVQFPATANATYKIAVDGFNAGSAADTGTFTIRISADIPQVFIDSGPENFATTTDNTPTYTFHSDTGTTFECIIDNGFTEFDDESCSSPFTTPPLPNDFYFFHLYAATATGEYSNPDARVVQVDAPPPPSSGTTTGTTTPTTTSPPPHKKCKKKHRRSVQAARKCKKRK